MVINYMKKTYRRKQSVGVFYGAGVHVKKYQDLKEVVQIGNIFSWSERYGMK